MRELRPWLYRVVHNAALNVRRASREQDGALSEASGLSVGMAVDADVERHMELRDALADVAALPAMQREAMLMSVLDGSSHEEVASALGITHGAVRGLLYRARSTLRAAATALTPQPLVAWLHGAVARVAPGTARLAEVSSQGADTGANSLLFKGAALALTTAALAAGAAVGPFRGHDRSRPKAVASVGGQPRQLAVVPTPEPAVGPPSSSHTQIAQRSAGAAPPVNTESALPLASRAAPAAAPVPRSVPIATHGVQPVSVAAPTSVAAAPAQGVPPAAVASAAAVPVAGSGESVTSTTPVSQPPPPVEAPAGGGGTSGGGKESGDDEHETQESDDGTSGVGESGSGGSDDSSETHSGAGSSDDVAEKGDS